VATIHGTKNAVKRFPRISSIVTLLKTKIFHIKPTLDGLRSEKRVLIITINPMELYHNQVTRVQGGFSLRMFHRSFELLMLQANIDAPCTVLDFASIERFVQELCDQSYDIIGISAIFPNIEKVRVMCQLIRKFQPHADIVVGGHITNHKDLSQEIDADYIVRGDGIAWFRQFLDQPIDAPVKHPAVLSAFGTRILGINLSDKAKDTAAILIPSVGCSVGCNFCSTSALFGGKGKFVNFYETGDELFEVMSRLESTLKVNSFLFLMKIFSCTADERFGRWI